MINTSKKLTGLFLIEIKNKFKTISGEDNLIDRDEFKNGLKINDSRIANRLFDLFDNDKSGSIDFDEFVSNLELLMKSDSESKIKFAFDLHDLDNNGHIDRSEVEILIKESFYENSLDYDKSQINLLVDEFFDRADSDKSNTIDFNEFLRATKRYPDFMNAMTVNPLHWLVPDRYEKDKLTLSQDIKKAKSGTLQVEGLGLLRTLLVPKFISFFNSVVDRKKIKKSSKLAGLKILPSRIMEITLETDGEFNYKSGDYVYLKCDKVSKIEWHPFVIYCQRGRRKILFHLKIVDNWTEKLYNRILDAHKISKEFNRTFDWELMIDGPYGTKYKNILDHERLILVGAGYGIAKFVPMINEIRSKLNSNDCNQKRVDLFWLIYEKTYFEWFTNIIQDYKKINHKNIFHFHVYFLDKSPDRIKDKLLYIEEDIFKNKVNMRLINDLWNESNFGIPEWEFELQKIKKFTKGTPLNLFYSGPDDLINPLKLSCKNLKIKYSDQ